ncbi:MAG: class I SAM-dependent methyltransferase [Myxococcota bacterium]|nr:class I SAM-dependent methyltransferase [Myxococcota bacterium]
MVQERHRLAVTTSASVSPALERSARSAAQGWGLPFVVRRPKEALEKLLALHAEAFLVCERQRVTLADGEGSIHFHPGLAHLRIKGLDGGDPNDTFGRITGLSQGESILDCTLGLAQDALMAARLVGPTGRVVAVERSLSLYAVMSAGLAHHDPGPRSARVTPVYAEAGEFLRQQPDRSFDVVYFDPMFEKPRAAQPSFELLRRHADYSPLTPEVLQEARRVARRLVVVKGSRFSQDLKKLGLTPVVLSRSASIAWGKLDPL